MTFGIRYYAELRSKFKGVFWRVEIAERNYVGASEEMIFDGDNPLSIIWEKRGDEFFIPVKGSEATINILCTENFHYIHLFTSDPRKYRVSIYRNTKLYWRGYVVSDLYSENFTAPPYQVSIKAIDGFNLLSSIPFIGISNDIKGRRSLWNLMLNCINLLELDVDVADWMDLFTDTMKENISPLQQTYVDMDRFYAVYDNPTYRDVLELCLRPFAAQIFQSNGALHIRRTVSLYKDNRPLSFYEIGSEFPSGWLITADGRTIVTEKGEPIITESSRDKIESMWNNDIHVQNDSDLDILPAIRNINITVSNKLLGNMLSNIGLNDELNWNNEHGIVRITDTSFILTGNTSKLGTYASYKGHYVIQCAMKLKLSIQLKAGVSRSSVGSGYPVPPEGMQLPIEYGYKIEGSDKTYWLKDDGEWSDSEISIKDNVRLSDEFNKKIEINGFPQKGKFIFYVKQTLSGYTNDRASYHEHVSFTDMTLSKDNNDEYEDAFAYQVPVNLSNNMDMEISLPIADIPNIPNDALLYSLYLTDEKGNPTRMWKNKGQNDYNSLVNHIVSSSLLYKQLPAKRIGGSMFTGKHIDMNTVVQDDKYLHAGFFVNSIDLSCLSDEYDSELVEMPKLLNKEIPPVGDDCIKLYNSTSVIKTAISLDNYIILLTVDGKILKFDPASNVITTLYQTTTNAQICHGDSSIAIVDGNKVEIINGQGSIVKAHTRSSSDIATVSTYMNGYLYILKRYSGRDGYYYAMNRPDFKYTSLGSYNRTDDYLFTVINGDIISLERSPSVIVINTSKRAYVHDHRLNFVETMNIYEDGSEIKSISDYFLTMNLNSSFRVYRRDTLSDMTLLKTISGKVSTASHTMGEVAYVQNNEVYKWNYSTSIISKVLNLAGKGSVIKNIFYLNGSLYIVRDQSIFKLIS